MELRPLRATRMAQRGPPWSDGLAGDVLLAGALGTLILMAAWFGLVPYID